MDNKYSRRNFIRQYALGAAGALAISPEEQALLAYAAKKDQTGKKAAETASFPEGKIGKFSMSRLMCGGNLISGFAHSRDLIYVSDLLKHYFTEEKIIETLAICEANGINTAVLRTDDDVVRILKRYWKETGGKIQWLAQTYPKENDVRTNVQQAIDNGAIGAFVQGAIGDSFIEHKHVDLLGEFVSFVKKNGLIAGVGSHKLEVTKAAEEAGINADFYMKTLNNVNYESANPDETIEYMKKVGKPWIAFKVLGAGVTDPRRGFRYAFANGADFLAVGMYDFQIEEDVQIALQTLSRREKRDRPWQA